MTVRPRAVAAVASVVTMSLTMLAAVRLGPPGPPQLSLSVLGIFATAMSITAAVVNPRDLLAATLLGVAPVLALGSDPSTAWMIAPMAVLLVLSAELGALAWALEGPRPKPAAVRRRLAGIAQLALLGLAGGSIVTVAARRAWLEGTVALAVAAVALAALAVVVLPTESGDTRADGTP